MHKILDNPKLTMFKIVFIGVILFQMTHLLLPPIGQNEQPPHRTDPFLSVTYMFIDVITMPVIIFKIVMSKLSKVALSMNT